MVNNEPKEGQLCRNKYSHGIDIFDDKCHPDNWQPLTRSEIAELYNKAPDDGSDLPISERMANKLLYALGVANPIERQSKIDDLKQAGLIKQQTSKEDINILKGLTITVKHPCNQTITLPPADGPIRQITITHEGEGIKVEQQPSVEVGQTWETNVFKARYEITEVVDKKVLAISLWEENKIEEIEIEVLLKNAHLVQPSVQVGQRWQLDENYNNMAVTILKVNLEHNYVLISGGIMDIDHFLTHARLIEDVKPQFATGGIVPRQEGLLQPSVEVGQRRQWQQEHDERIFFIKEKREQASLIVYENKSEHYYNDEYIVSNSRLIEYVKPSTIDHSYQEKETERQTKLEQAIKEGRPIEYKIGKGWCEKEEKPGTVLKSIDQLDDPVMSWVFDKRKE